MLRFAIVICNIEIQNAVIIDHKKPLQNVINLYIELDGDRLFKTLLESRCSDKERFRNLSDVL